MLGWRGCRRVLLAENIREREKERRREEAWLGGLKPNSTHPGEPWRPCEALPPGQRHLAGYPGLAGQKRTSPPGDRGDPRGHGARDRRTAHGTALDGYPRRARAGVPVSDPNWPRWGPPCPQWASVLGARGDQERGRFPQTGPLGDRQLAGSLRGHPVPQTGCRYVGASSAVHLRLPARSVGHVAPGRPLQPILKGLSPYTCQAHFPWLHSPIL